MNVFKIKAGAVVFPVIAVVLAAGCASTPSPAAVAQPAPTATAALPAATATPSPVAPEPTISFVKPVGNTYLLNADVTVTVRVSGFKLVNKTGQANVPGEGHIIYYLDVTPPDTPGEPALTATGTCAVSANTSCRWTNLNDGGHVFSAQLVNNDNTPLSPSVTVRVPATVYTD